MKAAFTKSTQSRLSNYGQNALIQLIAACAVGFILSYALYIIRLVFSPDQKIMVEGVLKTVTFQNGISPYIGLQPFNAFIHKPWVILTYVWAHTGLSLSAAFFNLLSNMLWLYCFGSVIQSLVGYKEIIPLFIFSYILSGCLFLGVSAAWPLWFVNMGPFVGTLPCIMSFAIAAITLAPKFRFYIGDRFAIPLWLVLTVFVMLNVLTLGIDNIPMMTLCAGGALVGFAYIKLLKAGYAPGGSLYSISGKVQSWFTPEDFNETYHQRKRLETFKQLQSRQTTTEESIDSILDKINMKGYDALSPEEKEILLNASKES